MTVTSRSESWQEHYDAVADGCVLFTLEARDYVDRLWEALAIPFDSVVLDFGCGWGIVACLVAAKVKELWCWDASAKMRERCQRNVRGLGNVTVLQTGDILQRSDAVFDLVIVNSVVQYMTRDELGEWLTHWRRSLRPGGSLVISDIMPPRSWFVAEVADAIRFLASRHQLLRSLKRSTLELKRYFIARRRLPLLRLSRRDIERLAEAAQLDAEFLPANLTHRKSRLSVRLRARKRSSS